MIGRGEPNALQMKVTCCSLCVEIIFGEVLTNRVTAQEKKAK